MKLTLRTAASAALAASLAFGVSAPSVMAAPADKPAKVQVQKAAKGKATKVVVDKAARKAAQQQRQALRVIDRKDAGLVKVSTKDEVATLSVEDATAVLDNINEDRDTLAALRTATLDGTTAPRLARATAAQFRPQSYTIAAADLHRGADILATVAANESRVGENAEAQGANEQARAAATAAVDQARAVTATTPKPALKAIKADLAAAEQALEAVEAALAPVAEEPVAEETTTA